MFKSSQELKEISISNAIHNQPGFRKLQEDIASTLLAEAKKGKTSCSIAIDFLVKSYMVYDTVYHEVSSEITELLEEQGYTVTPYSQYKDESLIIEW